MDDLQRNESKDRPMPKPGVLGRIAEILLEAKRRADAEAENKKFPNEVVSPPSGLNE